MAPQNPYLAPLYAALQQRGKRIVRPTDVHNGDWYDWLWEDGSVAEGYAHVMRIKSMRKRDPVFDLRSTVLFFRCEDTGEHIRDWVLTHHGDQIERCDVVGLCTDERDDKSARHIVLYFPELHSDD